MTDDLEPIAVAYSTEADAVARLAAAPVNLPGETPDHNVVALPPEWTIEDIDHEALAQEPSRHRGTTTTRDAVSFIEAVSRRRIPEGVDPSVYVDVPNLEMTAVLNDDQGSATGWRDYVVQLGLQRTPEWKHWLDHDRENLDQEAFARHIEDGLDELRNPSGADVLEIAQRFHASGITTFKSGIRLQSGMVQFLYEEDVNATAGELQIPQELELAVAPFYGAAKYAVTAYFRYRLQRDKLTLGYSLIRPRDMERAAFEEVLMQVKEALQGVPFINGSPAAPPRPLA
jgi:uncharacterized protein YfdQ (DUF2303 family)